MKNFLILLGLCFTFLTGCPQRAEIVKAYRQSEKDGVCKTYFEMKDGTWKCGGITYPYRLELSGRWPNAEEQSYYVVLTDNEDLTFEDVSQSFYGSLLEDSKVMESSVVVEMR